MLITAMELFRSQQPGIEGLRDWVNRFYLPSTKVTYNIGEHGTNPFSAYRLIRAFLNAHDGWLILTPRQPFRLLRCHASTKSFARLDVVIISCCWSRRQNIPSTPSSTAQSSVITFSPNTPGSCPMSRAARCIGMGQYQPPSRLSLPKLE